MESVPARGTVRRTVRVAVALIVGQALLCALIGYLTLGRAGGSGSVVQMAEPPPGPPPGVSGAGAPPSAAATTLSATTTRKAGHRARDLDTSGSTLAPAEPAPPVVAPEPPPIPLIISPPGTPATSAPGPAGSVSVTASPTVTPPPLDGLLPPKPPALSPSPSADPQAPVVVGDLCAPEWAFGRTADGTLVRCLRTPHHRPRWKIA